MDNQNLIKAALIFGGGFALFALLKPKDPAVAVAGGAQKSFDNELLPAPSEKDVEIVMIAYTDALKAGEPPARLTELNKELMKEFGMRCYIDSKTGKATVCDAKGDIIASK